MPRWWRKPVQQRPFGDNFNIEVLELLETVGEDPRIITLSAGAFYQLISINFQTTWTGAPAVWDIRLSAHRGQTVLYDYFGTDQGSSVKTHFFAVGQADHPIALSNPIAMIPLWDHAYLYPLDEIHIAPTQSGIGFTVRNLTLTLKVWPFDRSSP